MKIVKILCLCTLALLLVHCGATESVNTPGTVGSVLKTMQLLDTVQGKFIEIAQANLHLSPGAVLVQTTDWLKTQSAVTDAYWFDSTYIYIEMPSGLRTVFTLYRGGQDGTSLSRGGPTSSMQKISAPLASNLITNKRVLIYAPFVGREVKDLYKEGELDQLVSTLKNSDLGLEVTHHEYSECTLNDVDSFGYYGLVILSTHGLPDAFITGQYIVYEPEIDSNEAKIKEQMDYTLGSGGYEKVSSGDLMFCHGINIANDLDWQTYLKQNRGNDYRIIVTSEYIEKLPAMPGTVILANMCYSGWSNPGEYKVPQRGMVKLSSPIRTAFTDRDLISYYAYGYPDGTSQPVDNDFAKRMEDSLVRALTYDKDSTGNAYLNATGGEYTAGQLTLQYPPINPTMPLKHFGEDDYSYEDCVTEFTDERDGQKYKAVCIGKQNWMAENLRFAVPGSECYDSLAANCETFGRLYPWAVAMGNKPATNASPSGVQGICPKGWHIPSAAEWEELFTFLGGRSKAGNAMKLKSPLWKSFSGEDNSSGFTAIPGGFFTWNWDIPNGAFKRHSKKGEIALFLSTTIEDGNVQGFSLQHMSQTIVPFNSSVNANDPHQPPLNASCRCVKD